MRCGSRRISSCGTSRSQVMMTRFAARDRSMSATDVPVKRQLPYRSDSWTWIAATSGDSAGTATSFSPVYGHAITFAGPWARVSVPSSDRAGTNGTPIAAAV